MRKLTDKGRTASTAGTTRLPAWKSWLPVLGVLLLALPVAAPMFNSRMPKGDDALGYLPRQIEFHENISRGVLLPRWAPDLDRGAGQPFYFVPPMLHYVAEAWHLAGLEMQGAINAAVATLIFAFAGGMFLLGGLYFGVEGGLLCSAAALYAPYISLDLYVRAALSEFSAYPFCAFALYGFAAFAKYGRRRHVAIGALAYAGVILSHFMVAFYFTPLLVGFLLVTSPRAVWRLLALGLALGAGIGACVWLPVALESRYVQLERALLDGLRYSNHFLSAEELVDTSWGTGAARSYGLGWGHLLVAALAWSEARDRRWVPFFAAAAVIFCLLTLHPSAFVWDRLPLLQRIQFPYRLLGAAALCLAALAASTAATLAEFGRWRRAALVVALGLLTIPNLSHQAPAAYEVMDPGFWTPEYLAESGFETTTSGEFRPRWMTTLPPFATQPLRLISGEGQVRGLQATVRSAATAELSTAYYPGWQVSVDGTPTATYPAEATGLIRFALTPGEHAIVLEWHRTWPRLAGEIMSLIALASLTFLVTAARVTKPS